MEAAASIRARKRPRIAVRTSAFRDALDTTSACAQRRSHRLDATSQLVDDPRQQPAGRQPLRRAGNRALSSNPNGVGDFATARYRCRLDGQPTLVFSEVAIHQRPREAIATLARDFADPVGPTQRSQGERKLHRKLHSAHWTRLGHGFRRRQVLNRTGQPFIVAKQSIEGLRGASLTTISLSPLIPREKLPLRSAKIVECVPKPKGVASSAWIFQRLGLGHHWHRACCRSWHKPCRGEYAGPWVGQRASCGNNNDIEVDHEKPEQRTRRNHQL